MAGAKECDECGELYKEPETKDDYNKVTVQERSKGYPHKQRPKLIAFLRIFRAEAYNDREHSSIDHCEKCTIEAVRCFMRKFNIHERKGESVVGKVTKKGTAVQFTLNEITGETIAARSLLDGYVGKRIRLTVEEL